MKGADGELRGIGFVGNDYVEWFIRYEDSCCVLLFFKHRGDVMVFCVDEGEGSMGIVNCSSLIHMITL